MGKYFPIVNRNPDIFLSHSSKDKKIVRRLADDLCACEVDVWLDEWEIYPGSNLAGSINDGISKSKCIDLLHEIDR